MPHYNDHSGGITPSVRRCPLYLQRFACRDLSNGFSHTKQKVDFLGVGESVRRSSAADMTWPVAVPRLLGRGRQQTWVIVRCSTCAGAATVTCSCVGCVRTQREFQRCERGRWWLGLSHIRSNMVTRSRRTSTFTVGPLSLLHLLDCYHFAKQIPPPPQSAYVHSIPWGKSLLASAPPFTLRAGLCVRCNDVHLLIEVCQLITVSRWTVNLTTTSPDSRWD